MKNKLKKRLLAFATSLTLMSTATACSNEKNTEFETNQGTRNLIDYDEFLSKQGIEYKNCNVEIQDNNIYIFEKVNGTHKVKSSDEKLDIIAETYKMTTQELLDLNYLKEDHKLKEGEILKIYYYKMYCFTLEELDASSKWEYYVVVEGDDLLSIAQSYETTVEEICENNNIEDPNLIQVGITLKILKKEKVLR